MIYPTIYRSVSCKFFVNILQLLISKFESSFHVTNAIFKFFGQKVSQFETFRSIKKMGIKLSTKVVK